MKVELKQVEIITEVLQFTDGNYVLDFNTLLDNLYSMSNSSWMGRSVDIFAETHHESMDIEEYLIYKNVLVEEGEICIVNEDFDIESFIDKLENLYDE